MGPPHSHWVKGDADGRTRGLLHACPFVTTQNPDNRGFIRAPYRVRVGVSVAPLLCGEDIMAAICTALQAAKKSIDISIWAFDPTLRVSGRGGLGAGVRLGDLLNKKVSDGVRVRVLDWGPPTAGMIVESMVKLWLIDQLKEQKKSKLLGLVASGAKLFMHGHIYRLNWFRTLAYGQGLASKLSYPAPLSYALIPNVKFGETGDHRLFLGKVPSEASTIETLREALQYGTHHQKTVLVDYGEGGATSVGFVMGNNFALTDWDRSDHVHDDPRRDLSPLYGRLNPRQDVACMLRGDILHDMHRNYVDSWNLLARDPVPLFTRLSSMLTDYWDANKDDPEAWHRAGEAAMQFIKRSPEFTGSEGVGAWLNELLESEVLYWAPTMVRANPALVELVNKEIQACPEMPDIPLLAPAEESTECKDVDPRRAAVQLCRTFPLKQEMQNYCFYKNVFKLVNQFVYIENQYFRHSGLAETLAARMRSLLNGSSKKKLYVFIVVKPLDRYVTDTTGKTLQALDMSAGDKQAVQDGRALADIGAQVIMCLLRPSVNAGQAKQEGYEDLFVDVHTKVMIADDVYFAAGSTNFNIRSMHRDNELNVNGQDPFVARDLRVRLWNLNLGEGWAPSKPADDVPAQWFAKWKLQMDLNAAAVANKRPLPRNSNIVPYMSKPSKLPTID